MRLFISLIFALTLSACGLVLNTVPITQFQVQGDKLFVAGLLNARTPAQFEQIITQNPQVKTLVLTEIQGSIDDDALMPMYRQIRARGLGTHLMANSRVYSGGADLFITGKTRTMEKGAQIGVHSWSDGPRQARDFPRDHAEHDIYQAFVTQMLGSEDWYWFTVHAAPADDLHIMTQGEIARYGLLTSPPFT